MRRCKVLILAGGGIYGTIITHFLSMLPTDKQNLNTVNVISGCSVGGMLASAYALGSSFGYIDDVFQKRAKDCFTKRCYARINPIANPTYRSDTFEKVVQEMIGDNTVGDIKKYYPNLKYIVPALDVTNDELLVFNNFSGTFDDVKLVDVSMATSAAPSYFEGRNFHGNCIADGGIVDVTGVITAACELKNMLGIQFQDMNVLVIGTGEDVDPNPLTLERYNNLSLIGVAKDFLVKYAVLSNKLWSRRICNALGFNYYCYYNPLRTDGKLDDVSQIPSLVKEADKHREEFLRVWNYWISL